MLQVRSLASFSGLRIQHCCGLWSGSRMRLGSGVAVALAWAGGYSSGWTPSLGTSMCRGCSPKKDRRQKKKVRQILLRSHLFVESKNNGLIETETRRVVAKG